MAFPMWRLMLEEAKRHAVKAMDEYNSSTGNYADFVGHMIKGWLYTLHAEFRMQQLDFHYVDQATGKPKLADGEPKLGS